MNWILILIIVLVLLFIGYIIYVLTHPMEWWVNKVGDEFIKEREKQRRLNK